MFYNVCACHMYMKTHAHGLACASTCTHIHIHKCRNTKRVEHFFSYNTWLHKRHVEYILSCYDLMNVLPINFFLSPTSQEIQSPDTHQEYKFFSLLWNYYLLLTMTSTLSYSIPLLKQGLWSSNPCLQLRWLLTLLFTHEPSSSPVSLCTSPYPQVGKFRYSIAPYTKYISIIYSFELSSYRKKISHCIVLNCHCINSSALIEKYYYLYSFYILAFIKK